MAHAMTEGDVAEARAFVSACSEFPGQSGTVSLQSRYGRDWTWGRVSDGWQRQIHRRVLAQYKAWKQLRHETLDMFDAPEPDSPKRAGGESKRVRRQPYRPDKPYDESAVAGKSGPTDGDYNHPEDLPF